MYRAIEDNVLNGIQPSDNEIYRLVKIDNPINLISVADKIRRKFKT